jgi:hypothetical protein
MSRSFLDHPDNVSGGTGMKATKVLLLLLPLLLGRCLAQDVTVLESMGLAKGVVVVPVTTPWTSTGIAVTAGDDINILCNGTANTNTSLSVYWMGPEGSFSGATNVPITNAPVYSLIGKIGTSGRPFYVGRAVAFKANVSGILYLGYNDGGFGDNAGYYISYIFSHPPLTDVEKESGAMPTAFALADNYPNPFNPSTTIQYDVPKASTLTLKVFNSLGQEVATLVNEHAEPGSYSVRWNASNASSGIYFYRLQAGEFVETKKMVLLR